MAGKKPRGRQTVYDPEQAQEILDRLSAGESLTKICADEHLPPHQTVSWWVIDDRNGFASEYTRAREIGYLKMADELTDIADTPVETTIETLSNLGTSVTRKDATEHRRLQIETRKWILARVLPRVYGDKQRIEHAGSINTMSDDEIKAKIASKLAALGGQLGEAEKS